MANSALWPSASRSPQRRTQSGNVKATPGDWLDLALTVLALEGVDHVTVLNLSERLRVSRSSFYWYFRNRDELLGALLDCASFCGEREAEGEIAECATVSPATTLG